MKTSSIALVASILVALAAPTVASAADPDSISTFDEDHYIAALQAKGIDAVAVDENWNGKLRVTVADASGHQKFEYVYEDTLQPVGAVKATQTRVLSKVDTGVKASRSPVVVPSQMEDHFFD
jgi:hypothetical protein